jgi:hypothetical protein
MGLLACLSPHLQAILLECSEGFHRPKYRTPKVKFGTLVPNYYYFWNILFWHMPYLRNILQYSLFYHTKNNFPKILASIF